MPIHFQGTELDWLFVHSFNYMMTGTIFMEEMYMELYLDHISKKYKDKVAVDDVSLRLTPGVWGLLGANGAGKTTLMRMIAGIMRPTAGQVKYDGLPITELLSLIHI